MSEPFLGEMKIFGGNYPPQGFALCDGSALSIAQNDALFSLLGTTYGGDGQNTFALPDLRGRLPLHRGTSLFGTTYFQGELGGLENVTLTASQLPVHNHPWPAGGPADRPMPLSAFLADAPNAVYASGGTPVPMADGSTVADGGGNQPHSNLQPFLCLTFIIALQGIYPVQG